MELSIVDSIQKMLQESNDIIATKNKKYYIDLLDFLNLLFEDKATNICKIKFKNITLNENIFMMYNEIIKVHKLNKPEFDSSNFDITTIDPNDIKDTFINIAFIFSNNLLEKINYKLIKVNIKEKNKIEFKLKFIK